MNYRAVFKINGLIKPLKTCRTYREAYEHCMQHRKVNSSVECKLIKISKKDNKTIIDYGPHNAHYEVWEERDEI